jgi:DNA-binding CsgD family transcriptional regulator
VGAGFVGRAGELARLRECVAGLRAGVGRTLLIEGEQGIGKSALLREGLAGAVGCRVAWGAADELGQQFPLRLMVQCLGPEGQRAVGREPGLDGPVLAGDPVLAAAERLMALVDRLCAVSPVVVVAEDLQWGDEASLLVWQRLARAAEQLPLLVVGSGRPGPAGEEAGRLRARAAAEGTLMSLGPMSAAEVGELAGELLGAQPGEWLTGLMGQAGGNPLYVRELVDALVRDGRVRPAGGVAGPAGEPAAIQVPASLAAAIGERLSVLPGQAAAVLRWAAVLGQEFSVTDLSVVTGRSAGELAGVVGQAVAAGVLAGAGPRLEFRHGLIRRSLYEAVPRAVREALHLQAAHSLARAGEPAERVAAQLAAAPDAGSEWVWDWLATAAPTLSYTAPQVAAGLLRRALAHLPETDARREVLETGLVRVGFLLLLGDEVERVAGPLLARTGDPDRAAEVAWLLANTLARVGRPGEAAEVVQAALARPGTDAVWAARLRSRQAMIRAQLGELDLAEPIAREALAGAQRAGDPVAGGYALHTLAFMASRRLDLAAALDYMDRALAMIGDNPQTTDLRLLVLMNRAAALMFLDRPAEADSAIREALTLAEQTGTARLGLTYCKAAEEYFDVGQWDDALAVLEIAAGLPNTDYYSIVAHGCAALIYGHRDERAAAGEHLAAVPPQAASVPAHRGALPPLLLAQALAAEQAAPDRPREAMTVLVPCLDPGYAAYMPDRFVVLPTLVRLALAAGDAATAAAAAEMAAADAEREPLPVRTSAAGCCRGMAGGDPGPVLAAAAYYESSGRPLERAQALEEAAVLLAGRGDRPAAGRAFRAAAGVYLGLGAMWDLRRAEARLRPHGIRRGRTSTQARPAHGWDALTATEAKVAGLVAEGQSNPDIATALFLSRNTVQTHVSHILAKLGAHSRAEIIRQVLHASAAGRAGG